MTTTSALSCRLIDTDMMNYSGLIKQALPLVSVKLTVEMACGASEAQPC